MKSNLFQRHRIWLVLLLLILLQGCGYSQVVKDTVCITRTGAKYHRCTCRYLKYSSYTISMNEATKRGYTACSVCSPGAKEYEEPSSAAGVEGQPVKPPSQNAVRETQQKTTTSRRCTAYTKSGLRCKRTTTSASGRCWQHE